MSVFLKENKTYIIFSIIGIIILILFIRFLITFFKEKQWKQLVYGLGGETVFDKFSEQYFESLPKSFLKNYNDPVWRNRVLSEDGKNLKPEYMLYRKPNPFDSSRDKTLESNIGIFVLLFSFLFIDSGIIKLYGIDFFIVNAHLICLILMFELAKRMYGHLILQSPDTLYIKYAALYPEEGTRKHKESVEESYLIDTGKRDLFNAPIYDETSRFVKRTIVEPVHGEYVCGIKEIQYCPYNVKTSLICLFLGVGEIISILYFFNGGAWIEQNSNLQSAIPVLNTVLYVSIGISIAIMLGNLVLTYLYSRHNRESFFMNLILGLVGAGIIFVIVVYGFPLLVKLFKRLILWLNQSFFHIEL